MALDRKIKLPPTVQAYIIGIVGALVLGFGMSLLMKDWKKHSLNQQKR